MISQPQSDDRSWFSPVLDACGSGMTALGSLVTAFQRKPKRDIKRGVIPPQLVSEAAQSVFDLSNMVESHFERHGSFFWGVSKAEKEELESATFHASRATEAANNYDLGLAEVCETLEDLGGKFKMASGMALRKIEPLQRHWKNSYEQK
jgi:hypothetical protein